MERCLACEADFEPVAAQSVGLCWAGLRRALSSRSPRRPPGKERGVACPRPGGEPLYKMAALSVASRRLPGITQRKVLPIASVLLLGYNGPYNCCTSRRSREPPAANFFDRVAQPAPSMKLFLLR